MDLYQRGFLLQVMQEEIVHSDKILRSKIELRPKKEDEVKLSCMLNKSTTK